VNFRRTRRTLDAYNGGRYGFFSSDTTYVLHDGLVVGIAITGVAIANRDGRKIPGDPTTAPVGFYERDKNVGSGRLNTTVRKQLPANARTDGDVFIYRRRPDGGGGVRNDGALVVR